MTPTRHQPTLLIVWHSRTGAARQMAEAAAHGALHALRELDASNDVSVVSVRAEHADSTRVLAAQAYLFCAPENLGSLSGAMKEFLDTTYYEALDRVNGRPAGIMVSAGSDGQGAVRQLERLCAGWRLRLAAPAVIVNTHAQTPAQITAPKQLTPEQLAPCRELGGTLAALLA
jgi:multimeric flavodoxin WrbA